MKIAAVIPAFNEEKTISQVIKTVRSCRELADIIVVNDGSTDATGEIAKKHGVKVIDLPTNKGKGAAVVTGVKATTADIIVLIDADLIGLCPYHIRTLIRPVKKGYADMSVGVFKSGRTITDLSQKLTPFLNGQRALKREIFESLNDLELTRYGVDITISRYAKNNNLKVVQVNLTNITQMIKEEKMGFIPGIKARIKMYWEVLMALGFRLPPH